VGGGVKRAVQAAIQERALCIGRSVRAPRAVSANTRDQPARWRSSTLQVGLLVDGGDTGLAEQLSHAHDGRRIL
jgi:hypothetical protein